MKYAITGHTKGIGLELFNRLSPDVIGFSKSTGYDIMDKRHIELIADQAETCDVFINNAAPEYGLGQTYMFLEMARRWAQNPQKMIINVGSRIADIKVPKDRLDLLDYHAEKSALKSMSLSLLGVVKCRIAYRSFAYVGTDSILKKYPHFTSKDYISVSEAADIILS